MEGTIGTRLVSFAVMLLVALAYPQTPAADPTSVAPIGITPGMIITHQNWERYQQFMSDGLLALFEGRQFWRRPEELRIEVGRTLSIPLPKRYLADTARYSNQVKLVGTSSGGPWIATAT